MKNQSFEINLPLLHCGKVRELYTLDHDRLLMVASDRISAFDVILPNLIPGKGEILTRVSNFWFDKTQHLIPNHLTQITLAELPALPAHLRTTLSSRATIISRTHPLPFEAIVRGYLAGSGWKEYQSKQSICGIQLPPNLQLAEKLPQPIFTPSTKAKIGDHDINVGFQTMIDALGKDLATRIRTLSLEIYQLAADFALQRGIIIADTKFEFGLSAKRELLLIDEILTPDSSRFWDLDHYQIGSSPISFDKQFVRDYLHSLTWDKTSPAPQLPQDIIQKTTEKYLQVEKILLTSTSA